MIMENRFQLIAHRGASSICPENTRSAFLKALEIEADWIEADIRLSKDGRWVIIHDPDLKKHIGTRQKVEALTLAELKQYDLGSWFGFEFKGETILTLEEACHLILPRASLILDVKTEGQPSALAASLKQVLERENQRKVLLSSFSLSFLKECHRVMPDILLGYLFDHPNMLKTWLAYKEPLYSLHPHQSLFTSEMVERAHSKGLKVFVWTVNRAQDMEEVMKRGADGFFTDFPHRAKGLFEKQKHLS